MAISLFKRQVINLQKDPYVPPLPRRPEDPNAGEAREQGGETNAAPLAPRGPSGVELSAPPARVSIPVELLQCEPVPETAPAAKPVLEGEATERRSEESMRLDLSTLTVGIGWKIREERPRADSQSLARRLLNSRFVKSTLLGRWLAGGGDDGFDLDVIGFLLDKNGHVFEQGDKYMVGSDVIFFNNPRHFTGAAVLRGDNRMGGAGVQDEEQLVVKLSQLKSCYEKVKFMVAIYDGQNKQQHFGQLKDAYIRAVDAKGREFARCDLDKNPFYVGRCLLVFAEVVRQGLDWKFHMIAEAHSSDNFESVLADHLPLT